MNTVTVTTNCLITFNNEFDKFVKKANKLGFPVPVIVESVESEQNTGETTPFGTPVKEKIWDITVNYEIPIIDGWKVVGNRELVNDIVVLNTIDTESDLSSYNKSNKIYCEHCGTNHKRKKSILIKNVNTGTIIEVGTACLKDFIPVPLKSILYFSDLELLDNEDNKFWSNDRVYSYNTKDILTVTSALIRKYGYTSNQKAYEYDTVSTSDCVKIYFNDKERIKIEITDTDKETADTVIEYFKGLDINEYLNNNYMSNLIKLLSSDYVDFKHFGYVCSAIPSYERIIEKEKKKTDNKKSEFVGNVKDKLQNIEVELTGRKLIDGYYGVAQMLTFKDNDGNIYVSFYTGKNDYEDYVNEKVSLSGTIKKHNDFNGIKQTILNRISI